MFGIMPSFPESQGPQTVLVKVKDTQKAWLTKFPYVFLLLFEGAQTRLLILFTVQTSDGIK